MWLINNLKLLCGVSCRNLCHLASAFCPVPGSAQFNFFSPLITAAPSPCTTPEWIWKLKKKRLTLLNFSTVICSLLSPYASTCLRCILEGARLNRKPMSVNPNVTNSPAKASAPSAGMSWNERGPKHQLIALSFQTILLEVPGAHSSNTTLADSLCTPKQQSTTTENERLHTILPWCTFSIPSIEQQFRYSQYEALPSARRDKTGV